MEKTIFKTELGIFKAETIDYRLKTISGYKLFSGYGESNSFKTFNLKDVKIETVK